MTVILPAVSGLDSPSRRASSPWLRLCLARKDCRSAGDGGSMVAARICESGVKGKGAWVVGRTLHLTPYLAGGVRYLSA